MRHAGPSCLVEGQAGGRRELLGLRSPMTGSRSESAASEEVINPEESTQGALSAATKAGYGG